MLSSVHAVRGRTLPLYLAVVPVFLAAFFQKFVQSPQSPTFILKFLNTFRCSIIFQNVQNFYQNSIFVVETHVYTKASSATNLPSNARSVSE